jgi:NDP-sugar pyrophosphorylase family protein
MSKRAVILAGGLGMRLRPYTTVLPKPLMPVGEYPILEVVIRQLAKYGFTHITLAVNHQADIIKAYFQEGLRWGVKIDYSLENTPLGTMGPLRLIPDLPDNFLVMNGDILTDLNFASLYEDHVKASNNFTISSVKREQRIDYGVLEVSEDGKLSGFKEKPSVFYQVSMGINMLNKKVLDYIPLNKPYGFDNLMLDLLRAKTPAAVRVFSGYWLDIGRPDDYERAIEEFDSLKVKLLNG